LDVEDVEDEDATPREKAGVEAIRDDADAVVAGE
jgi:hypothetical protein